MSEKEEKLNTSTIKLIYTHESIVIEPGTLRKKMKSFSPREYICIFCPKIAAILLFKF